MRRPAYRGVPLVRRERAESAASGRFPTGTERLGPGGVANGLISIMMQRPARSTRGFTLIELLVVIAIIGILSAVVLASLNTARAKARDAQRISNIKSLETAMELYYTDHGTYPEDGTANTQHAIAELASYLTPKYISTIPDDPLKGTSFQFAFQYVWGGTPAGSGYAFRVYLESSSAYCKTGVNVNMGWWNNPTLGTSVPLCDF
jgi:type II secretion system protein G